MQTSHRLIPNHFVISRTCLETKHLQIVIKLSKFLSLLMKYQILALKTIKIDQIAVQIAIIISNLNILQTLLAILNKIVIKLIKQYKQIMLLK